MSYFKQMIRFSSSTKRIPLGRWCHKNYDEKCCSKVQDRKAYLASIDNSFDVSLFYKNNEIRDKYIVKDKLKNDVKDRYTSSEDLLLTYIYNKNSKL